MQFARRLWTRIEPIHAVAYFDEGVTGAGHALGLKGFWRPYFAFRGAPLGAPPAGAVAAAFANFSPAFVARYVPEVWAVAETEVLLAARVTSSAAALRAVAPRGWEPAAATLELLEDATGHADPLGRPLFGANLDLPLSEDPFERLWQLCTTLREHRGDGHVAALAVAGIDGCEAHVVLSSYRGVDPEWLQKARGWTSQDWGAAVTRLAHRGITDADGTLTPDGVAARDRVELQTDRMAGTAFGHLEQADGDAVLDQLRPLALAVSTSVLPFPNPIGVPPPD